MDKKYQIFVSSTFVDLKEERVRAREGCRSAERIEICQCLDDCSGQLRPSSQVGEDERDRFVLFADRRGEGFYCLDIGRGQCPLCNAA